MGPAVFPKSSRLLARPEFRRVYDEGKRVNSASFAVFYRRADRPASGARAGFTVPRAVGKSVARNRIRRRLRAAVRMNLAKADPAMDFVFNPRRTLLDTGFPALLREVEGVFLKCRT